jgi:hypothetical protein
MPTLEQRGRQQFVASNGQEFRRELTKAEKTRGRRTRWEKGGKSINMATIGGEMVPGSWLDSEQAIAQRSSEIPDLEVIDQDEKEQQATQPL